MTRLEIALAMAAEGFWLFPIKADGRTPAHKGWQQEAARDERSVRDWIDAGFNIGVFTGKFRDDEALLVVDVDDKKGKRGSDELVRLELEGFDFPTTRTATTPSGGRHLFFSVAAPVRQGVDVFGRGLDVRSGGGYVVGAGSQISGAFYAWVPGGCADVAPAPVWAIERCGVRPNRNDRQKDAPPVQVDVSRARARGREYLDREAPLAVEGSRSETGYKVAARMKDFGLSETDTLDLMMDHWADRCTPPFERDDLATRVRNAYEYGLDPVGAAAPEADFPPAPAATAAIGTLSPFDKLNTEFAFVLAGGGAHILWETTDVADKWRLEHLTMSAFHDKHAAWKMTVGKKTSPVTKEWMEWSGRRSYDSLVFRPQQTPPARFYNLWKGFAVEPADGSEPEAARRAFNDFLAHAHDNVCNGNEHLFKWLMGYFAHMIQQPGEKPLVALVFQGSKGVGKNALLQYGVGPLLGGHFLLASNRRYLVGNFNGHLENCLLFVLDEAFWSGDKQAEGTVKDLITGTHHVIEHKGKEPYTVDNLTRVVIIGNEDWLVPASHDERRFACFNVGDGRKQDRPFFNAMKKGMAAGGSRLLLSYLLAYDLTGIDLNGAPSTTGLLDQKHATLDPVPQWWHACLAEGRIVASDFGGDWPQEMEKERFRSAFGRYLRERNIRSRVPDGREIGKHMHRMVPLLGTRKLSNNAGYVYKLPTLGECRAAWDKFIGHEEKWPE